MNKPSLKQLIDRAKATMVAKLGVDNPAIDALAAAIGGGNYGNYAYQDYLFKQMHPETANEDFLYLWAERFNTPRISPVQASGFVQFETAGVVNLPAGILLQTTDGNKYTTTASGSSDGPIACRCDLPGVAGNLSAGVKLTMISAVPGVSPSDITVVSMTGGTDIEDLAHWRARLVTAFNERYVVGKLEDYVAWAKSAHANVGFAFARDNTPVIGHVSVYVGAKSLDPTLPDEVLADVLAYLNERRLAGCHLFVERPVVVPVNITIAGVSDLTTRLAIEEVLASFFIKKMMANTTITATELIVAISYVTSAFELVQPLTSVSSADDSVLTLGAITWMS